MIRAMAGAFLLLVSLVVASCSGGGSDDPGFESQPLPPAFETMLAEVADIRGLPAPTGIRLGAVPRQSIAEFVDSQLTDEERAEFDHLTHLYRLQGHLSTTQDLREVTLQLLTEFAIGFYSPIDRTMWLVRDDIPTEASQLSQVELSTLAHEFVHAVQDNAFDLGRVELDAGFADQALAISAVIEGDAVAHERLWLESNLAAGNTRVFLLASAAQSSAPASIEREIRFSYEAGLDWVGAVRAESGQSAVDAVLRERRPITTAEIMHPTIRSSGWLPQEVVLPDLTAGLGEDWELATEGDLGEFRLANYLQLWLPSLEALGAAQGWTGDRFGLYTNDETTLAVFRVKFFDPKDAGEFAQAHLRLLQQSGAEVGETATATTGEYPTGRTVIQLRETASDEVIFVIASSRDAAESAANLLLNG